MSIRLQCKQCGKNIKAPDDAAGKTGKCPGCKASIKIPNSPTEPVQAEPVQAEIVQAEIVQAEPVQDQDSLHNIPDNSASGQVDNDYGFPNYGKYAEYTKAQHWKAIFDLNKVSFDSFGTKKELQVFFSYLEADEVVFALVSGVMHQTETSNAFDWGVNTWLVALTNERFLFVDHAMLTKSVDTQSIRHNRVQAVSASQGWMLGKIMIDLGARTVIVDNCNKATVSIMASLANKWLKILEDQNARSQNNHSNTTEKSPIEELEKLAKLHEIGALSDDEFREGKAKLLSKL